MCYDERVKTGVSLFPPPPPVWAAWGNIIEQRPYLPRCVSDMIEAGRPYGARWYSAGARSSRGHPHHPLYLRKDSVLDPFDAAAYCKSLGVTAAKSESKE